MWCQHFPPVCRKIEPVLICSMTQIGHLKEVIESMLIHPRWTAATMGLFNGNIELENASTLQQNSITESSTLHAFLPYEVRSWINGVHNLLFSIKGLCA